jgi:hypothetical protein
LAVGPSSRARAATVPRGLTRTAVSLLLNWVKSSRFAVCVAAVDTLREIGKISFVISFQ